MELSARQIRAHRLRAHHLDQKYPFGELLTVAGTCGLQNSPPGAWETAAFCRLKDCTLPQLHQALYQKKELLQAWSIRGVPLIFPTADSGVFFLRLLCRRGGAVDLHQRNRPCARPSGDVLCRAAALGGERSRISGRSHHQKQGGAGPGAGPADRRTTPGSKAIALERPSMYGAPDRQTVGGAAVSFLLRPCSFKGLVVFGEREGISPTFTSRCAGLGTSWFHLHKAQPSLHAAFCTPTVPRRRAPLPTGWAVPPLRQSGSGGRLRRSLNR